MKLNYYFKTDKSLGVAVCDGTGEFCSAYLTVSFDADAPSSEDDALNALENVRKMVASQMGVSPELIYPLTEEEYLKETD